MGFHDLVRTEQSLLARCGTAYFTERLGALTDAELGEPTLLQGWTRRHLVAHVSYNAVALGNLLDWAATGNETPMYTSPEQRGRDIEEGATMSPAALRNLFDHTVARLDEKWRNLPDAAWDAKVFTVHGRSVPAVETLWMRSREVWIHTVDLANGGRFDVFPDVIAQSLLDDVVGIWRKRDVGTGLAFRIDDRPPVAVQPESPTGTTITGSLAAVTRWATGRGAIGITTTGPAVAVPSWL
ncbi:maleylpyruvate isomerase family mycothiol-dependent enzyme [Nocardia sp. NBC_00565]|uniref:maleylpyruvate isomerase family mycothiol-dependent enzyme n=1 Tax=Nocardia sp. NBC_00565 TaxID=2975993 RepID=UPI002E81BD9F|nr:maleylpyruvate isomerase family mycothiol-dependent enzyme [Nocardia sp. NBC_00565]WUC02546.1 maleylpyruvate isomerase family mycothiol-dependent enzyme [Nocardia sp. NBC_00565]